jgi:hypothetical protein
MSDNDEKNINTAAAGVVGAVIGAAAATAAIALSNKENRKKVGQAIKEIKTEGSKRFVELRKAADQIKDQVKKSPVPSKASKKS